jgi:hypothetical protein
MGKREIIITGLYGLLALAGTSVVTGYSMTVNAFTPQLVMFGWLGLAAGLGGLFYMFRTTPKAVLVAAHEVIAGPPPREFVGDDITTEVLRKKIEGRTSLQVEGISKTYTGKWKRLQGRVIDVNSHADSETYVMLRPDDDSDKWQIASITFGKIWYDQVAVLNIDDWVAVIGKIHKLRNGLALKEGEIVHMGEPPKPKAEPKPRAPRKKAAPKA